MRPLFGVAVARVPGARQMFFGLVSFALLAAAVEAPGRAEPPDSWLEEGRLAEEADPEFQRHYVTGAAPWIQAQEQGGIAYLLFEFPPRVLRYDLAAAAWLPYLPLTAVPSAMAVDDDGLYVAFGSTVRAFSLDGSGGTDLYIAPFWVQEMVVDGPFLFLAANRRLESIDKASGALIDSREYFYGMSGLSLARSTSRIYARSTGISPSDILVVPFSPDGTLGSQQDSFFHGDYPGAVRTFVLPGDSAVADNSGLVYTGELGYGGSLAGPFDDLAFHASGPIALRGEELFAHGWNLLETGRFTLQSPVRSIFVWEDSIFGFFSSTEGADVIEVPVSALEPRKPGDAVDPSGLAYTPDQVLVDAEGVVHLLSLEHLGVFRWSRVSRDYLPSIALVESPQRMAYSADNRALYLDYPTGKVTTFDLTVPGGFGEETPLLNSPQRPCGLATAGPWIFLCDPSGAWVSHFTYGPHGELISQVEWNYFSLDYVWSPANGRMYHLRDDMSPNDILWEVIDPLTGTLGAHMDSPLHSSAGMVHPIRVHPDGFIVLLGSGRFHNALTLALLAELGTSFVDAQWFGAHLVTLHAAAGGSELRFWNDYLATVVQTVPLPGDPLHLLVDRGDLIAITSVGGIPEFTLYEQLIFHDGFEPGDTSAWSDAEPDI